MTKREHYDEDVHRLQLILPKSLWMKLRLIAAQEDRSISSYLIEGVLRLLEQKEKKGGKEKK